MVKEGVVTDTAGKQWKQVGAPENGISTANLRFKVRAPFIDGIGAVDQIIERIVTGATGEGPTGYEVKIRQIYKVRNKLSMFLIKTS
jgi:hypothetical protein